MLIEKQLPRQVHIKLPAVGEISQEVIVSTVRRRHEVQYFWLGLANKQFIGDATAAAVRILITLTVECYVRKRHICDHQLLSNLITHLDGTGYCCCRG